MGLKSPKIVAGLFCIFTVLVSATGFCDEVVIDGKADTKVSIGDFDCSQCPSPTSSFSLLAGANSGVFTAGELWKYFDSQGVNKLDRMTLCLDLQPIDESSQFGLESVEFKIQDPSNAGGLLTDVSMGDNSLIVPGYDITSFKPEAKLEIALGYDFMTRFSANSTEKISIDVATNGDSASSPVFSVEGGGSGFFSKPFNTFALVGFAAFWILVFVFLNRFTKPQTATTVEPSAPQSTTTTHRALSA